MEESASEQDEKFYHIMIQQDNILPASELRVYRKTHGAAPRVHRSSHIVTQKRAQALKFYYSQKIIS